MNIIKAWNINSNINAFTLPIRITNPMNKINKVIYAIFDTGFTGCLGLESKLINELGLKEIGSGQAILVSGIMEFKNYEAQVELIDDKQTCLVEFENNEDIKNKNSQFNNKIIPIQEFKLPIMGMELISQCSWMIIKEKHMLCLISF